jgi:hypothetical protein
VSDHVTESLTLDEVAADLDAIERELIAIDAPTPAGGVDMFEEAASEWDAPEA